MVLETLPCSLLNHPTRLLVKDSFVMFKITKSDEFQEWVKNLKDRVAAVRIATRIDRAVLGNLGSYKHLRDGISEMKIDFG